jgi:hypothetical protein
VTDSSDKDFDKEYPAGRPLEGYDTLTRQEDPREEKFVPRKSRDRKSPVRTDKEDRRPTHRREPAKKPSGTKVVTGAKKLGCWSWIAIFTLGGIGYFLEEHSREDSENDDVPIIETMCFIEPKPPGLFPENESSHLARQIRCQLTEKSATVGGQVCWQIEMMCLNEPTQQIDQCQRVSAGEIKVVLLTAQDYPSIDTCELVEGEFKLTKTEVDF